MTMNPSSIRSRLLAAGVLAALVAVPVAAAPAAAPKAPASPADITAYYDGGGFTKDTNAVVKKARAALERGVRTLARGKRGALVLDIDDTSLSTYPCQKARASFAPAAAAGCILEAKLPAITQTKSLFQLARRRKVRVVFITGRPESIRTLTEANLRAAGYRGWSKLVMKPATYTDGSLVPYKSAARKAVQKSGVRILLNVGDQRSDLSGGAARATALIPNPMYVTP